MLKPVWKKHKQIRRQIRQCIHPTYISLPHDFDLWLFGSKVKNGASKLSPVPNLVMPASIFYTDSAERRTHRQNQPLQPNCTPCALVINRVYFSSFRKRILLVCYPMLWVKDSATPYLSYTNKKCVTYSGSKTYLFKQSNANIQSFISWLVGVQRHFQHKLAVSRHGIWNTLCGARDKQTVTQQTKPKK